MNLKERLAKIAKKLLPLHTEIYFGDMNSDTREEWIFQAIAEMFKAIEELLLGEEEMEKIVDIIKDDWKFPCSIAIAQALYKAQRDKLR